MNNDCNGDWLRHRGKVWYRCFLDGTVIRNLTPATVACPRCQRRIDAPFPTRDNPRRTAEMLLAPMPGDGYHWIDVSRERTVPAGREARG